VQPVVLMSIGVGVQQGVLLSLYLALWVLLRADPQQVVALRPGSTHLAAAVAVLGLVPVAALLARPMSGAAPAPGRWCAPSKTELDPRRGLEAVAGHAGADGCALNCTGDQVVGVVLPSAADGAGRAVHSTEDSFTAQATTVHRQLEALLPTPLPDAGDAPAALALAPWCAAPALHGADGAAATSARCRPQKLRERMDALASCWKCACWSSCPHPLPARHGHLLLGMPHVRSRYQDVDALSHAAPELLRIVEQAALVDQLQARPPATSACASAATCTTAPSSPTWA
jgi:hypothetical protein